MTLEMIQFIVEWKAFDYAFSKINIQSSSDEFSLFFRQNFDFKHSMDTEMSLEEEETKIFKDWAVQKVWKIKESKNTFFIEERV